MANHRTTIVRDSDQRYYAQCTCGATNGATGRSLVKQHAEDWEIKHAAEVEKVRANLHRGRGSLRTERDHARKMLDDPNTPEQDRPYWQLLYDGAVSRIGTETPPKEESLF